MVVALAVSFGIVPFGVIFGVTFGIVPPCPLLLPVTLQALSSSFLIPTLLQEFGNLVLIQVLNPELWDTKISLPSLSRPRLIPFPWLFH